LEDAEMYSQGKATGSPQTDPVHILKHAEQAGLSIFGGGILVSKVDPGGAAWDSGVEVWDLIVLINGLDVRTGTLLM
jgi:hypothetical protein